ncbi:MAG: hypothetical protein A3F18_07220 [Legionellales bacterium RIFCSPHIGHO2_12_FULL_37_14]|nr:MAG: hypothetical protein A3F18_07220 [Legionellales bacterium RIFCSPHIGHO2_12_FULL_37_14]
MHTYPIISDHAAVEIVEQLLNLREKWSSIRPGFSVLGTPLWLKGVPAGQIQATNCILQEHFGNLLEKINIGLAKVLGEPIKSMEGFSLPGFHIFESLNGEDPIRPPVELHYDSELWGEIFGQDPKLSKKYNKKEFFNPELTLSFTLSLKLPKTGTGLYTWPTLNRDELISYANTLEVSRFATMACLLSQHKREYIPYKIGHFITHNGQVVHWIPPMAISSETIPVGEQRITLQGHGIKHAGVWEIFW